MSTLYPAYPPHNCPACGIFHDTGAVEVNMRTKQLEAQVTDLITQSSQLREQLDRANTLIKNQNVNVEAAHKQVQEMSERSKVIEAVASEQWRQVAVMLEMELPLPPPERAYQGPPKYTPEYIFGCLTEIKGKLSIAMEVNRQLQGRVEVQKATFERSMKAIGSQIANKMLQIDAPPDIIDAEEVE